MLDRGAKEFQDIERYKNKLKEAGTVRDVEFSDADEGLRITFENGTILDFGFSGCEGSFTIE